MVSIALAVVGLLVGSYLATPYRSAGTSRTLLILAAFVFPCGLVGLVLGGAAVLRQSARSRGQGRALAGLLLSGVVVVLAVVGFVVVGFASAD